MPRKKELSFEESLTKLEAIVKEMESGDSSLKDLMDNYTEGMKLGEACLKELAKAEAAMDVVVNTDNGKIVERELTIEGE
ncbi:MULTISPECIES: exodeoxyribonuclease VII small subunit [Selenomonas]|jgi:exodeoxyribonuclease VII small subunit|uniref:Exodeoxyribonuclease 7 small subunit n=1 Tax=Selenomonas ruminantium TaxID=971 RepID=A0A1K1MHX5_SELRU|nr:MULTISPECIES: exodeoxyribonuclease VII small subunit [Selenomonas]MBE6083902.1 exodeoxyribonuclease VII small subunit [Selenomonas ruminantium]SDZ73945.1 Exodeoxyribonuclease VII small subunit [Selenomonas ruminantium]SFA78678.1 Exodeoxyribonuclease VII small subunit [Selenomonas ruminantium]SFW22725.1 Exodeoxyribonuclease VII small subunit [Selenomonas ruminantium]